MAVAVLLVAFVALSAPLLSGAQQPPPRDAAPKAEATGTAVITGRVVAGDTDQAVAGAIVYLSTDPPQSKPPVVLTDRAGRFVIDKLPADTYRVSVSPPEHTGRFVYP